MLTFHFPRVKFTSEFFSRSTVLTSRFSSLEEFQLWENGKQRKLAIELESSLAPGQIAPCTRFEYKILPNSWQAGAVDPYGEVPRVKRGWIAPCTTGWPLERPLSRTAYVGANPLPRPRRKPRIARLAAAKLRLESQSRFPVIVL